MTSSGRDPILVVEEMYSPPRARFTATYGEWDLGDPLGTGATPEEAIEDLKWDAGEEE